MCEVVFDLMSDKNNAHVESTSSRPITEVKQRRAWFVLGWGDRL